MLSGVLNKLELIIRLNINFLRILEMRILKTERLHDLSKSLTLLLLRKSKELLIAF